MRIRSLLNALAILLLSCVPLAAQSDVIPRDADEEQAWRIYREYTRGRDRLAQLRPQITQTRADVNDSSQSSIGLLGSDPSDRERLAAMRREVAELEVRQKALVESWDKKFYWRYGDLTQSDQQVYDAKTKRTMDKIEFALIYFPFNLGAKLGPGSAEWKAAWASISTSLGGVRYFKTTPVPGGTRFSGESDGVQSVPLTVLIRAETPAGASGQLTNLEGEIIDSSYKDYVVQFNVKTDGTVIFTKSGTIPGQGGELRFAYTFDPRKTAGKRRLSIEVLMTGGKPEFGKTFVTGEISLAATAEVPVPLPVAPSAPTAGLKTSQATSTRGTVTVSRDGRSWKPLGNGDAVAIGDKLKTASESSVTVNLAGLATIALGGGSSATFLGGLSGTSTLRLDSGNARFSVAKLPAGTKLVVESARAVATVVGTSFEIWETADATRIQVDEGVVEFRSKIGGAAVSVKAGQSFLVNDRGLAAVLAPPQVAPTEERLIFSTGNDFGVLGGGTPPSFTLRQAVVVTYIMTYHWNGGRGAPGGTVMLRGSDGAIYGPWRATVVNNVYWIIRPEVMLMPGTYQVIDSDPETWAQNGQSGGKGHVIIKGSVLPD